jgi:hypothetical protein
MCDRDNFLNTDVRYIKLGWMYTINMKYMSVCSYHTRIIFVTGQLHVFPQRETLK